MVQEIVESLSSRVKGWTSALYYSLTIFLTMRLALSLLAALLLWLVKPPVGPHPLLRPYQGVEPITGGWAGLLLGAWQRFDTLWYLKIATQGYSPHDGSAVYFPLYPLLIRVATYLVREPTLAALLVSNLAYIGLLLYLYRLTASLGGEATAGRTAIYMALFPTAFFFLAGYTESLFLFFVIAAFWYAERGRWWPAGLFGFLASLTRLQGLCLLFPLLYLYLKRRRVDWNLVAISVIPLGAVSFLLYQRFFLGQASLIGTYEAYLHAQFVLPWDNISGAVRQVLSPQGSFIDLFNLIVTLVFLAMAVVSFYRLPPEYGLYMATTMAALLLRRTTLQPLVSMSRYALALFPAFMIWGKWGERPWVNRLILYPSVALLIYLCGQFVMWGWVA